MKLFGNNIEIKSIKNGKCRKFKYNPTLRVPKSTEALPEFKKEDFEL